MAAGPGDLAAHLRHRACSFWDWARRPISRPASRPWRNGSRRRSARWPPGLFNSGANIGAMVVPAVVPFLLLIRSGWRGAFVATGAAGFVWLVFWLWLYRKPEEHPGVSPAELALIQSDPPERDRGGPWVAAVAAAGNLGLRRRPNSSPIRSGGSICSGCRAMLQRNLPPDARQNQRAHLDGLRASCFGSVGGGWLSGALIKRGKSVNVARKTAMLICAVAVMPVLYAPYTHNLWVVVALVGLAMAAHQGWSANLFTLTSDLFPRVGGGQRGGHRRHGGRGWRRADATGSGAHRASTPTCRCSCIAGSAYLVALVIVHLLSPKLRPAEIEVTIRPASDRSLQVEFGDRISLESHRRVFHLTRALAAARGILNLHPAYASVLIDFDPRIHITRNGSAGQAAGRARAAETEHGSRGRLTFRCNYGGEFGPDLEDVAKHTGLSPERVVELYASAISGLLFGVRAWFRVSRRASGGPGDAASFRAAQTCAGGERGHRRESDRRVSDGFARRLADYRTHGCKDVRPGRSRAGAVADGRPAAVRKGDFVRLIR